MHLIFLGAKEMSTFFLCDTKIKFLRLFSIHRILKNLFRFNPYSKILENLSKYFFAQNLTGWWIRPISGKLIHFFSKFSFPGFGKSWKTHPIFFPTLQFSAAWQRSIFGKYIHFFEISISEALTRQLYGKFIQSQILELWDMTVADFWKTYPGRGFSRQELGLANDLLFYEIFMDEFSRNQYSSWVMTQK